jgi:hypothetical protein
VLLTCPPASPSHEMRIGSGPLLPRVRGNRFRLRSTGHRHVSGRVSSNRVLTRNSSKAELDARERDSSRLNPAGAGNTRRRSAASRAHPRRLPADSWLFALLVTAVGSLMRLRFSFSFSFSFPLSLATDVHCGRPRLDDLSIVGQRLSSAKLDLEDAARSRHSKALVGSRRDSVEGDFIREESI